MKYICALLAVSDMKRSRNFYENLLGQTVKYDFGENVTFHGDFAIHLQSHFKELIDNREINTGGNSFELYFEYDNVDEIVGLLKENSVPLIHEIREQPWRQKVVRCYDPDSHIVEIGESIEHLAYRLSKEGLPIDEIAQTTNMPIDFVMASVAKYEE
jgi:catechol 2,3-dioxygenase-like lactoylglutathione lyase family enzyme